MHRVLLGPVVAVVVFSITACHSFLPGSLIERVYVLDYDLLYCSGCDDEMKLETIRALVDAQRPEVVAEWLRSSFRDAIASPPRSLEALDQEELFRELSWMMTGGFVFINSFAKLSYRYTRVDDLEEWEGTLTRYGSGDRVLWTVHIPVMGLPVVPFVVGDKYLYVGGADSALYIGDLGSGRIVQRFLPAGVEEGFDNPNSSYEPPFFRDGVIYLERGGRLNFRGKGPDRRGGPYPFAEPPVVYVLKVRL